ncbi:hypothetical protein E8E13_010327 [Curvularia kusanoi]|uniref:C2H2-type domain-containing protein n=1 Tax=Curvularia kusanoi TaxID=90978 RepID=A0A9P4THI4_CURKU|nr:hypothetical protein E8E13_010327 [Curvularia kusanoi]
MIMSYYSPEVDMVLLAPEENMNAMSPFSSCQSPPNIMYSSPPLHQMAHPVPTTLPSNGPIYTQPHYRPVMNSPYPAHTPWSSQAMSMPPITSYSYPSYTTMTAGPVLAPDTNLLPQSYAGPRASRSHSASSSAPGIPSSAPSERTPPRSLSPSSPDLRAYGFPNKNGTWHAECPQATGGGFSSKKDLARHEAKHNPGVLCDWAGCDRVFSRVDNMRDHVKRIHHKASRKSSAMS